MGEGRAGSTEHGDTASTGHRQHLGTAVPGTPGMGEPGAPLGTRMPGGAGRGGSGSTGHGGPGRDLDMGVVGAPGMGGAEHPRTRCWARRCGAGHSPGKSLTTILPG
ncbi:uncharacterized protein ACIBXB_000597 [Morphnus guianensis]